MYIPCIHSFLDRRLDCFRLLAVVQVFSFNEAFPIVDQIQFIVRFYHMSLRPGGDLGTPLQVLWWDLVAGFSSVKQGVRIPTW